MHKPQNIVVTGGSGFIGSHFIRYMLNKYSDIKIINIDKLTYAGSRLNNKDYEKDPRYGFCKLDICSEFEIEQVLIDNSIDTIVHFAAESHVDRSIAEPSAFVQTNVVGTHSLLEASRKVWQGRQDCRFHHISTDEVYGSLSLDEPAFTETTPYAPKSPYSASKAASDHLVDAYFNTYKLPVTITNCSNNYGPNQHAEKLIPTVINNALQGKSIPIYGKGSNIRDWLYVEDHCEGIDLVIQGGRLGEKYNIGADAEYNNLDLVKNVLNILAKQTNVDANEYLKLISFVEDRKGHDFRYAINFNKINSELGWKPKHDLQNGMSKTVEYYMDCLLAVS